MTKYILAGGYVHEAQDGGRAFCEELIKGIKNKPVKILDCLFARPEDFWQEGLKSDYSFLSKFIKNFQLELAQPDKFTEQIKESDIIFLKGGYTSMLHEALSKNLKWIQGLDGKVLAGTSAGAEVIAKYYLILKNFRIGDGFGLLPIKFIPHWNSKYFDSETQDIDYDKALIKLKGHKEDIEILTLREGEFKVFEK